MAVYKKNYNSKSVLQQRLPICSFICTHVCALQKMNQPKKYWRQALFHLHCIRLSDNHQFKLEVIGHIGAHCPGSTFPSELMRRTTCLRTHLPLTLRTRSRSDFFWLTISSYSSVSRKLNVGNNASFCMTYQIYGGMVGCPFFAIHKTWASMAFLGSSRRYYI